MNRDRLAQLFYDTIAEQGVYVSDWHESLSSVCVDGYLDFFDLADAVLESWAYSINKGMA